MSPTVVIVFICAALALGLAVLALARETRALANWAYAAGMALLALESVCVGMVLVSASSLSDTLYWQRNRLLVLSLLPGCWLLFSLTYSRGNYRQFLAGWKYLLILTFLVPLVVAIGYPDELFTAFEAEPGAPILRLTNPGKIISGVWLLGLICAIMNLERTFMASVGTMRWRIKFMVIGLALLFAFRVYTCSQSLLYSAVAASSITLNVLVLGVACLLMAVALFRARISEIEIYPSQAVLTGSVTAFLAGVYLLAMGIFAKAVAAAGGDVNFPLQAFVVLVAVAALGVLLLSDRLQQRARLFVSRHFRRPHYDYRVVWSRFTESTGSFLDRTSFCRAVARFISETFNSLSVTVWLLDEQRAQLNFAASTLLSESEASAAVAKLSSTSQLIERLRRDPSPVDIEVSPEPWVSELRQSNPDFFLKGGNRVCVPLVSGGELLGLIILGDRVSGVRFSLEDLDLLKCMGDQVAASLRNLKLSEQLTRAKEVEAFQVMSTFVVHDLKNVAYTLAIMLQNMRQHFDNPEFRADAMTNLARSVEHINDLISRFSALRQGLAMNLAEADLNEVVIESLAGLETPDGVKLTRDLEELPKLALDKSQMQKVIVNLVINARDAVGEAGEIRLQTRRQNGWVVLTVSDNGCGMSQEFLGKHLFKPFQSTKKKGLGIGMYHSKTIVEAHHGRIEVESAPQKGTTFRVLLPVAAANA